MSSVRERQENFEKEYLSPFAAKSCETAGRETFETECELRTAFQRDRDRIIHSKSFRRLKDKTQVFLFSESDHCRTRLSHTIEVSQIARTVSRALRLNEDLTEAIALAHDLGHTPFGHSGERLLNTLYSEGFSHYEQGVRVCRFLERGGEGLNLTAEVLDGILHHTSGELPSTAEGRVVRLCDRIAYVNHDFEDAVRAGILSDTDLPNEVSSVLGNAKSVRIDTLVKSLVNSSTGNDIRFDEKTKRAYDSFYRFLSENVYKSQFMKNEESKADRLISGLYEYLLKHPEHFTGEYELVLKKDGIERATVDYISGMTDHFAMTQYTEAFKPEPAQKGSF